MDKNNNVSEVQLDYMKSIFKKEDDQVVFDYIYSFLSEKGLSKEDDNGDGENFYTKFHNISYLANILLMGRRYRNNSSFHKGISMDICDYYLEAREELERSNINYDRSIEANDTKLETIVGGTWNKDTSAYVLVLHKLKAHDCNLDDLDKMRSLASKLKIEKYPKLFPKNNTNFICKKLNALYINIKDTTIIKSSS